MLDTPVACQGQLYREAMENYRCQRHVALMAYFVDERGITLGINFNKWLAVLTPARVRYLDRRAHKYIDSRRWKEVPSDSP
jgi:hypothetical protein